jgi:phospholipid/cholesterol/gamma-HCH transport system ATP-binding protein
MDGVLELRDVAFRFEGKPVLAKCSFAVERGARFVVMGPSGTGKSTLLRLILGILRQDSGSIRFEDRELEKLTEAEWNEVRRKMGMVFQSAALISSITVAENLALPLRELTDEREDEIARIVDEQLERVGLADAKAKLPGDLSGGMRKRAALARALVLKPELILFDEPTAGLDPVNASIVDELIVGLTERSNATCIVVTHDMENAFRIATHMAMLYEGTIVAEGPPEAIRESQDPVVRQFISGDPHGPLTEGRRDAHPA